MPKGYKRDERGIAVLRFLIGLFVVAIVVAIIYFFLQKVDYSDKLVDPATTIRAYVENPINLKTAPAPTREDPFLYQPQKTEDPDEWDGFDSGFESGIVDLTVLAETPEPTQEPTPTPTPSPTPSPTPTPTPVPTPTPSPTPVPSSLFAAGKYNGFTVPNATTNGVVALTRMDALPQNNNSVIYMTGYGYYDIAQFNGDNVLVFLICTQRSSNRSIAYQCTMANGVSGSAHDSAVCLNPSSTDFEIYFDVSQYPDGTYGMGLVLYYADGNTKNISYHILPESFTVSNGFATVNPQGLVSTPPAAMTFSSETRADTVIDVSGVADGAESAHNTADEEEDADGGIDIFAYKSYNATTAAPSTGNVG